MILIVAGTYGLVWGILFLAEKIRFIDIQQTLLKVMLQVCSVTYLGSDNNYKCTFIQ